MADTLPALLQKHKEEIKALLPGYLDVERFILNAQTVTNNRDLKDCSADSLYRCCLDAARKGWEVGGGSKHCAIVAFKLKSGGVTAILIPQWQGKAFLWSKSGAIRKLKAEVVYAGDTFEMESGDEDRIIHRPDFLASRSPKFLNSLENIIGAYAIAWLASGERVHSFVSRSQLARTMENVKKKNGDLGFGWTDWLPEMCRKTAIHRLDGVIQPPPDMTAEQLEAWGRVKAPEAFDAEITGEELPPDDLPQGGEPRDEVRLVTKRTVDQAIERSKASGSRPIPATAETPAAAGKGTPLTNSASPARIADADIAELSKIWRSLHNNKIGGLDSWLMQHFEIEDLSELTTEQVAACAEAMSNG